MVFCAHLPVRLLLVRIRAACISKQIDAGADGILVGTAIMDAPFERTKALVDALFVL